MKKILLLLVASISMLGYGQVSKTNSTPLTLSSGPVSGSRTFTYTAGDFGGCTSLTEVEIAITMTMGSGAFDCDAAGDAYSVQEDLGLRLTSPTGTSVDILFDKWDYFEPSLGNTLSSFVTVPISTILFDDDAVTTIGGDWNSFAGGSAKPVEPFSAFDGEDAAGIWTLSMCDGNAQFSASDYFCITSSTITVTCGAACVDPTVPTLTYSPATVCEGNNATLNISGTLNDATNWSVYTGSCGGTLVGTTAGSTFVVTPSAPSTTYYVRGEGGCVIPGSCGSVTVNVTALDDASFSYGASSYCVNAADPTPTITGLLGGTFSSTAGLSINASTGQIDVSASTPSTYTVTYTTAGSCPNSSNVNVTINALDNPSFSYSASAYCANAADPTPTITGLGGGTFSSTAGLSINASTGTIDVSASTPNTYTVTYTTAGACPNSSNVNVTINALDNASFSYSASAYCVNASDPTPTITGLGGGTFTSTAGLSINASTGTIDVSASTPNTYTVTYTTAGTCPNASNVNVTINALDNPSFSYSASAYCANAADPTPTITGLGGGTFSSTAGLSINASTGTIDVSASTPNTYTVTYTTAGTCPNSSNVNVTVNAIDNASFSYSGSSYCMTGSDPTPTITGLGGGTFSSSPAGLSINASTGTIDVSASTPNTYTVTYTTSGTCPNSSNVNVTVTALDDASFSYGASAYCVNAADPTPSAATAGGTYTSSPAGLSINASTGTIDVSASTPNMYTVTYTTSGACSNSSNVNVTINALDNASFSYGVSAYCVNASDPTPTITGLGGGTFSSTAGLSINASTGTIDVSASTPNTYTVTYTTAGACPNSSNVNVTINALDNASFSYGASAYCVNASDPTPTITGLGGGTFTSSPAGLSINASTGTIDVSASAPNTYTVTYTTSGTCPNSSNVNVTINALDDASFSYAASTYCPTDPDPTPTITGLGGGTFTSSPAGLSINASTGTVDLSLSSANTYTITYTTAGACPNSSNVNMTIGSGGAVTAVCQNVTVYLDATGNASIVAADIDGGSTIGCGVMGLTASQTAFTCADVATPVSVTLTVDDGFGGTDNCTALVTVFDTISPLVTCTDITVQLDSAGVASITPLDLGATATPQELFFATANTNQVYIANADGSGTPALLYTSPTSNAVGVDYDAVNDIVYWTGGNSWEIVRAAADGSGTPTTLPNASGLPNEHLDVDVDIANLRYFFTTGNGDDVYSAPTDGVSPATMIYSGTTAVNSVDYNTASDQVYFTDLGSSAVKRVGPTGTGLITLFTSGDGVSSPRGITCNAAGTTIYWVNQGTGNIMSGNADGTGTPTVIYSGLSQPYHITIDDATGMLFWTEFGGGTDVIKTAPATGGSVTILHSGSYGGIRGIALGADAVSAASVTDNCGTPTATLDISTFDCTDVGTPVAITLTGTDASGNSASCTSLITVEDNIAPDVMCQNITVYLDASGNGSLVPGDLDAGTTDNCGIDSLSASATAFTCANLGSNNVTLYATDVNGNVSSCVAVVTVMDTLGAIPDVASLPDVQGECYASAPAPTATTNCGVTVFGVPNIPLPTTTVGTNVVIWSFTSGGITTTQSQNFIVSGIDVTTSLAGGTISANNTTATAYEWIDCSTGTEIPSAGGPTFTPTSNGSYAVVITEGTCVDTSACVTINDVSLNEIVTDFFSVYPNPTSGELTIQLNDVYEHVQVQLVDVQGKLLRQQDAIATDNILFTIEEPTGIYFVKVNADGFIQRLKVIKQ